MGFPSEHFRNVHRIFINSAKENAKLCEFPSTSVCGYWLIKTDCRWRLVSHWVPLQRGDIMKAHQSTVIRKTKTKHNTYGTHVCFMDYLLEKVAVSSSATIFCLSSVNCLSCHRFSLAKANSLFAFILHQYANFSTSCKQKVFL